MKFKRSILLWRNRIAFNGIAEPFCKENTFWTDIVRQLCFEFWFQGLSVVTACFLLLATVILPDLSYPRHIPRDNKCVKRRLFDASGVIAICKESSFQCLHNVGNCGLPKCEPVYEMRTYHVTRGNRKVAFTERVTVNCICSKCGK